MAACSSWADPEPIHDLGDSQRGRDPGRHQSRRVRLDLPRPRRLRTHFGHLLTKGGNKTLVASTLDLAFREEGWREAQYKQTIETCLHLNPYRPAGETQQTTRRARNEAEGHQVDNVRGRVALDVEWNVKDGNLDRDISNFRALYDAGQIDMAVLVTRTAGKLRDLAWHTIAVARRTAEDEQEWDRLATLRNLASDPLGSTTTTNLDKLLPRLARGDAAGCPMLAIAITERCYVEPTDVLGEVAAATGIGESVEH